jgi:AraC-like DNA-binding protein
VSDPDAKIPFHKHAKFLTLAAEATGDSCFGINASLKLNPRQSGVLGYVLLNSATLGDALGHFQRYHRVLSEGWDAALKIAGEEVALEGYVVDPLVEDERQLAEGACSLLLRFCEVITGEKITPIRVEFRHKKHEAATGVKGRFGCPILFGQERVALVFQREVIDYAVQAADDELLKILKRYCRQILGQPPRRKDLSFEVRELITALLPSGQATIDNVARELGMSARTLRRRLADEGLVYKHLLDDLRHKLALSYLSDKRISLKQVAYLLGYADLAAFNHAFHRWTGASPSTYRKKN